MKKLTYQRYRSKYQETKENSLERTTFENNAIKEFRNLYSSKKQLKIKIDGEIFHELKNEIGLLIQHFSREAVKNPGSSSEITQLLKKNPIPKIAREKLPEEFRVFCLCLNAVKVWISKEQRSTDAVLLGGRYKTKLEREVKICLVTGQRLKYRVRGQVNFHHPMRDGRMPIPLSKKGHDIVEDQMKKQALSKK